MKEKWVIVDKMPNYVVSNFGIVESRKTGIRMSTSRNQQGVEKITLHREGRYFTVGLALLVAQTFLPEPPRDDFTTPIQLDGDRSNCREDNLMWRPRWFAIKYHQERRQDPFPGWRRPFEVIETGEVFNNPKECAVKYGILEDGEFGIFFAIMNEHSAFPSGLTFKW
jgi:hypothetical protein